MVASAQSATVLCDHQGLDKALLPGLVCPSFGSSREPKHLTQGQRDAELSVPNVRVEYRITAEGVCGVQSQLLCPNAGSTCHLSFQSQQRYLF